MGIRQGAMESVVNTQWKNWRGCRVLLTGHTGFKGSWLSLYLHRLGARVHGFALPDTPSPSLFEVARVAETLACDFRGDITNSTLLEQALQTAEPEVVFHFAAQSLVRTSHENPVGTFATNVLGTVHLLDAIRRCPSVRAVVVVTTDKVYANPESDRPFTESDPLGGDDPYSASKAAAEIATSSMRQSFFGTGSHAGACIATARAGNVIGGGDWSSCRLVPDCLAAFSGGLPVRLRYPGSIRPWQHVLDPLRGYVRLAEALCSPEGASFATAWNFGPDADSHATVLTVARQLAVLWGGGARVEVEDETPRFHEAGFLRLDSSLVRSALGWRPAMDLNAALRATVTWHQKWMQGKDMHRATLQDIEALLQPSE